MPCILYSVLCRFVVKLKQFNLFYSVVNSLILILTCLLRTCSFFLDYSATGSRILASSRPLFSVDLPIFIYHLVYIYKLESPNQRLPASAPRHSDVQFGPGFGKRFIRVQRPKRSAALPSSGPWDPICHLRSSSLAMRSKCRVYSSSS